MKITVDLTEEELHLIVADLVNLLELTGERVTSEEQAKQCAEEVAMAESVRDKFVTASGFQPMREAP